MKTEDIRERFNQIAGEYDSQRKKFIPCFDDYYGTMTAFIAGVIQPPASILDLGAGTGLLSKCFYDHFPDSRYTLTDISEQMLEVAAKRFEGLPYFRFEVSDYSLSLQDEKYDLICSALSIHHLENEQKARLYGNIFEHLSEGGTFITLDQFDSASAKMNQHYNDWWYDCIRKSGLPESEHEKWRKRRELDRENTIEDTMALLSGAGFKTVECLYRFMKFGVIVAFKGE